MTSALAVVILLADPGFGVCNQRAIAMSQMSIIKFSEEYVAFSWTTGLITNNRKWKIRNDDDAIAYAMYLSRRGEQEKAENFLDCYCS